MKREIAAARSEAISSHTVLKQCMEVAAIIQEKMKVARTTSLIGAESHHEQRPITCQVKRWQNAYQDIFILRPLTKSTMISRAIRFNKSLLYLKRLLSARLSPSASMQTVVGTFGKGDVLVWRSAEKHARSSNCARRAVIKPIYLAVAHRNLHGRFRMHQTLTVLKKPPTWQRYFHAEIK